MQKNTDRKGRAEDLREIQVAKLWNLVDCYKKRKSEEERMCLSSFSQNSGMQTRPRACELGYVWLQYHLKRKLYDSIRKENVGGLLRRSEHSLLNSFYMFCHFLNFMFSF